MRKDLNHPKPRRIPAGFFSASFRPNERKENNYHGKTFIYL